jgi:XisI protein
MDNLREIVCREVKAYAGKGLNGVAYFLQNDNQDVFAVVDIAKFRGQHIAESGLIVRLIGDQVIIEQDTNSKPLVDALLQAGVPREKIVLTYAGETIEKEETLKT